MSISLATTDNLNKTKKKVLTPVNFLHFILYQSDSLEIDVKHLPGNQHKYQINWAN